MSGAADLLREIANAGRRASSRAPGDFGTALELGALGVDLVAHLVELGHDPRVVIPELRDALPLVESIRRRRAQLVDTKFPPPAPGPDTDPSPPPSGPSHDPGDEHR